MGFVSEELNQTERQRIKSNKVGSMAVVYGKEASIWKVGDCARRSSQHVLVPYIEGVSHSHPYVAIPGDKRKQLTLSFLFSPLVLHGDAPAAGMVLHPSCYNLRFASWGGSAPQGLPSLTVLCLPDVQARMHSILVSSIWGVTQES